MLKKVLVCLSLIIYTLFLSPVNASALAPQCPASLDGYTKVNDQPIESCPETDCYVNSASACYAPPGASVPGKIDFCSSKGITLQFPAKAPNNGDVSVQATFPADKNDGHTTYSILISSAGANSGTPIRNIGSLKFLTNIPLVGSKIGDFILPIGNNDSESPPSLLDKDNTAVFLVPPLTEPVTHYVKVKAAGTNDPVCMDSKTIEITDASNTSDYLCGADSVVGKCVIGAGAMCDDKTSVKTAIGCIPTKPDTLINGLVGFIARMAGGIALLLMAFGAIGMITSQGNAEALKSAQQRFISAIVGLLFIILAVTLLQIIGVDILNIPGFGR